MIRYIASSYFFTCAGAGSASGGGARDDRETAEDAG